MMNKTRYSNLTVLHAFHAIDHTHVWMMLVLSLASIILYFPCLSLADPKEDFAALLKDADKHFRNKDYRAAIQSYEKALGIVHVWRYRQDCARAEGNIARCCLELKEYDKALEAAKIHFYLSDADPPSYMSSLKLLAKAFKSRDGDLSNFVTFLKFQLFGSSGQDGKRGAEDDLRRPTWGTAVKDIDSDKFQDMINALPANLEGYLAKAHAYMLCAHPAKAFHELRKANRVVPPMEQETRKIANEIAVGVRALTGNTLASKLFLDYLAGHSNFDALPDALRPLDKQDLHDWRGFFFGQTDLDYVRAWVAQSLGCVELMLSLVADENPRVRRSLSEYLTTTAGPITFFMRSAESFRSVAQYARPAHVYVKFLETVPLHADIEGKDNAAVEYVRKAVDSLIYLVKQEMGQKEIDLLRIWQNILEKRLSSAKREKVNESPILTVGIVDAHDDIGLVIFNAIIASLSSSEMEDQALELCEWSLEKFPDHLISIAALERLPTDPKVYRNIVTRHGRTKLGAEAAWRLGDFYYHDGDYSNAVKAYQILLNTHFHHSKRPAALEKLADCYAQLGDSNAVLNTCNQILREVSSAEKRIAACRRIAQIYQSQGKYREAIQCCKEVVENYPSVYKTRAAVKLAFTPRGRLPTSHEHLADFAKFWLSYLDFARGRSRENNIKDNVAHGLQKFASEYPDTPEAALYHYEAASDYFSKWNIEKAMEHILAAKRVASYCPEIASLTEELSRAQQKIKGATETIAQLDEARKKAIVEDEIADISYRIAELYVAKKAYDYAILELRAIVEEHSESEIAPKAQQRIATIYEQYLHDETMMRKAYQKLIMFYPDHELAGEALKTLANASDK